jgi:hypothetical protein
MLLPLLLGVAPVRHARSALSRCAFVEVGVDFYIAMALWTFSSLHSFVFAITMLAIAFPLHAVCSILSPSPPACTRILPAPCNIQACLSIPPPPPLPPTPLLPPLPLHATAPYPALMYQPGDKEFIKQSVLQHLTVRPQASNPPPSCPHSLSWSKALPSSLLYPPTESLVPHAPRLAETSQAVNRCTPRHALRPRAAIITSP